MLNEKSTTGQSVIIGAGTMGGGIAAQLANAGWSVRLLDVAGEKGTPETRNAAAIRGLQRIRASRPPLLFLPELAERIQVGNIEDDLDCLADADWICEAVPEEMALKRELNAKIDAHANPNAVITSNTSSLSLRELAARRSAGFRSRFLGTHFFNPPRYLKLVELIVLPDTDPEVACGCARFLDQVIGRRPIYARDTPGFISNRIGPWAMSNDQHTALEMGLTVEETDALTGPLIGRPKSALFRLQDIVGLDVSDMVGRSQYDRLPNDYRRERLLPTDVMTQLIAEGRLGQKSGAGFYKKADGEILALDFESLAYRPRREPEFEGIDAFRKLPLRERIRAIPAHRETRWGAYLTSILTEMVRYSASVAADIADDALSIDRTMMWGFNWEIGPLDIGDLLHSGDPAATKYYQGAGPDRKRLDFRTNTLQPKPDEPEYIDLADLKAQGRTVRQIEDGALVDLGDGVLLLEFLTKMGTLNPALCALIDEARETAARDFRALVVGHQGRNFSAGYNINLFIEGLRSGAWAIVPEEESDLQGAAMRLKYCSVPVVAAPFGYTLGGGCELALHCSALQAFAELQMGLPETSIGILPAGGGTKEMLARAMEGVSDFETAWPRIRSVFGVIARGVISGSAHEARKNGYLRAADGISLNPDRLLFEARRRALAMADAGYRPPARRDVQVFGEQTLAGLKSEIEAEWCAGAISDHDRLVSERVAWVLAGGDLAGARTVSEEYLLRLEREAFASLCREPKSQERMEHTLKTGKPLRN
jgi:3-hydroxyacyl-CoA dehydrogenase